MRRLVMVGEGAARLRRKLLTALSSNTALGVRVSLPPTLRTAHTGFADGAQAVGLHAVLGRPRLRGGTRRHQGIVSAATGDRSNPPSPAIHHPTPNPPFSFR